MLTAMRLLTVMLALWSSLAGAADLVVHIEQYRHVGCQVGDQRHLPTFAGDGALVRHVYPGGKKQCLEMITYAQQGCRMATIYSPTNDGAPWQPGEQDMGCLPLFNAEVSQCVAHYKMEGVKCVSAPARETGGSAAQPAQPRASVFEGRWLVTDKNVYGYTHTFVCTISVSGTRIEKRCEDDVTPQRGTVHGQVASLHAGWNSFAYDLRVVDQNTLRFEYPYGKGTYRRQ